MSHNLQKVLGARTPHRSALFCRQNRDYRRPPGEKRAQHRDYMSWRTGIFYSEVVAPSLLRMADIFHAKAAPRCSAGHDEHFYIRTALQVIVDIFYVKAAPRVMMDIFYAKAAPRVNTFYLITMLRIGSTVYIPTFNVMWS